MDTVNHIKLRVERSHAPAILRALLTAVFFHRRLDNIEPETIDVLETHVAAAVDRDIEREVQSKVDAFTTEYIESGADSGEIAIVFLQRKNRKGWFAITEALVPWEEHLITMTFVKRATTNPLPGALLQLLSFCAERKGNVPPLVGTSDQNNLSHQIILAPEPPEELFRPASPTTTGRRPSPPPRPASSPSASAIASERRPSASGGTSSKPLGTSTLGTIPGLVPRSSARAATTSNTRSTSPMAAAAAGTAMGYLEQAKDGLLAGAKAAGAGVGWGGRAVGAAFGSRG